MNEFGIAFSPSGDPAYVGTLARKLNMLSSETKKTHNLIGMIEGSDPELKDEYIVIGAHLDHIGMSKWIPDTQDNIYNGADDNGTGSGGVLEIARALINAKSNGNGPKRSVVFMLFSGEELGLLGSQYFVNHPTVPLEKIKGMINLDMIGRLDPTQMSAFAKEKNGQPNYFDGLIDTSGTGIQRIDHNIDQLLNRSDQYAFYVNDIPVAFLFEGFTPDNRMNPDYHGLGDHADLINYKKAADITRIAYRLVYGAANR